MAIRETTGYAVHCDNCGEHYSCPYNDFSWWTDKGYALESAHDSDWWIGEYHTDEYEGEHADKHYCTSCASWHVDDDDRHVVVLAETAAEGGTP